MKKWKNCNGWSQVNKNCFTIENCLVKNSVKKSLFVHNKFSSLYCGGGSHVANLINLKSKTIKKS